MDKLFEKEYTVLIDFLKKICGDYLLQISMPNVKSYLTASSIANKVYFSSKIYGKNKKMCIQGDFDRLPFLPGSIDAVVLPHILEFVERPKNIMEEVYKILTDDGYLIITGFNSFSLYRFIHFFRKDKGKFIGILQINQWLTQLRFSVVERKLLRHPIFDKKISHILYPKCDIYIIVARKKVVPLTLITDKVIKTNKVTDISPQTEPSIRSSLK